LTCYELVAVGCVETRVCVQFSVDAASEVLIDCLYPAGDSEDDLHDSDASTTEEMQLRFRIDR